MKKNFHWTMQVLSLTLLTGLPVMLSAQDDRFTKGANVQFGVQDAELIERLMPIVQGVGGTAREMLQQQSVKAYMMPVRKVGERGSDLSYALATCLEYYINIDQNYKINLSPDYISLNIENTGRRVTLADAFRVLAEDGTVNAAIVPYEAIMLTDAVYATQKYKISNYLHIFREVTPGRQRVYEVRKALMRGNPVLVELRANQNIKTLNTRQLQPTDGDQLFPLIVVGYDESQQALEVLSCWGREWAAGGYAWISYEHFGKYAANGYVLAPAAGR